MQVNGMEGKQNLRKYLIVLVVLLATILGFLTTGVHNVREWDEARNGVNAYEMLHNGDYINLYYEGKPDTWNAKPPLLIWLIVLSYKLFGFNEFALRLPAVLSAILFFVYCFKIVLQNESPLVAFFTCLVLMSCKAVFGLHIGLTADFDAPLLLFLTASVYHFSLYLALARTQDALLLALFTGLAFYTKGPAALVLVPGFLLYILVKKKWWVFRSVKSWAAVLVLITIVCSWFFLLAKFGVVSKNSFYGSKNAIETMLVHDTFQRLTNPAFDITGNTGNVYLFFFEVLDARLNLWNYVFYVGVFIGIYSLLIGRYSIKQIVAEEKYNTILLSACLIFPLALILTVAATKNNWYLAPLFMFVGFIATRTMEYMGKKQTWMYVVFGALLIFTFLRQVVYVASLPTLTHRVLCNNRLLQNREIIVAGSLPQDLILHLKWLNAKPVQLSRLPTNYRPAADVPFISRRSAYAQQLAPNRCALLCGFNDFYIGVWKGTAK